MTIAKLESEKVCSQTDNRTPEQRRRAMAANRGRIRPERRLAAVLWRRGLRYLTPDGYLRRYRARLTGAPDIISPTRRVAVFMDGCFWRGCETCRTLSPSTGEFWLRKVAANRNRDKEVNESLQREGWSVVRVWEHEPPKNAALRGVVGRVEGTLARGF